MITVVLQKAQLWHTAVTHFQRSALLTMLEQALHSFAMWSSKHLNSAVAMQLSCKRFKTLCHELSSKVIYDLASFAIVFTIGLAQYQSLNGTSILCWLMTDDFDAIVKKGDTLSREQLTMSNLPKQNVEILTIRKCYSKLHCTITSSWMGM